MFHYVVIMLPLSVQHSYTRTLCNFKLYFYSCENGHVSIAYLTFVPEFWFCHAVVIIVMLSLSWEVRLAMITVIFSVGFLYSSHFPSLLSLSPVYNFYFLLLFFTLLPLFRDLSQLIPPIAFSVFFASLFSPLSGHLPSAIFFHLPFSPHVRLISGYSSPVSS